MANTYDYKVTNLIRDPQGIVVTASFTITASDGVDSFTHNYNTGFANKPVTPTPFEDLTEAKVIEWIKRDAGAFIAQAGVDVREQGHCGNAERRRFSNRLCGEIDRIAEDPRHGGDLFLPGDALDQKYGPDQIRGRQRVFPHEAP